MQQFIFNRPNNEQQINMTDKLKYNLMVMEIANNWPVVRWLLYRINEKLIDKIDTVENDWINFINTNKLNIESFKNSEEFLEKMLKPLVKEN